MSSYKKKDINHKDVEPILNEVIKGMDAHSEFTKDVKTDIQTNFKCKVGKQTCLIQVTYLETGKITLYFGGGKNIPLSKKICDGILKLNEERKRVKEATASVDDSQAEVYVDPIESMFPYASKHFTPELHYYMVGLFELDTVEEEKQYDISYLLNCIRNYFYCLLESSGKDTRFDQIEYYFQYTEIREMALSNETALMFEDSRTRTLMTQLFKRYILIKRAVYKMDEPIGHPRMLKTREYKKKAFDDCKLLIEQIAMSIELSKRIPM